MKYSIIFLLMIIAIPASADVRIFLYPRCEYDGQNLKLENIAWIEGESSQSDAVRKIRINESFLRDGFIDRQELGKILKVENIEMYSIVGNSTKVVKQVGDKAEKEKLNQMAAHAVKKGDRVTVSIHSGKIFLEMAGTAAAEACPGDEISVDLGKKKTIRGILKEDRKVEVKI